MVPLGDEAPTHTHERLNNMPNIKEISDGGPNPNTPTIEKMRESQRLGSTGKGTQTESYAETQACFNIGTGEGGPGDKPNYPRPSNDEKVSEYADADSAMPWE